MRNSFLVWLVFVLIACEKDPEIPVGNGNFVNVSTSFVTNIQDSRATSGISISNLSPTYVVQERGICWGLNPNPTIDNLSIMTNVNDAPISLFDLIPGQKYYVRAFAKINGNYTYGNQRDFVTSNNSSLSNGLVTYLPLNEDSKDYSSSGNNLAGSAVKTYGRMGVNNSAYFFNGSNNYLTLSAPKNIPSNNGVYSISVWFKANVWNREMAIFGYGPSGTAAASNYMKTMPSAGLLHYHWNLDYTFTRNLYTNSWTHVVITYDGATERYYLNGQLISSWPHAASPLFVNPSILSLGARVVNVASNDIKEYFNGSIDELRIYNRVLTQSEAFSLYSL